MGVSLPERECAHCGEEYPPNRAHQKYCSAECRQENGPRRKQDRRQSRRPYAERKALAEQKYLGLHTSTFYDEILSDSLKGKECSKCGHFKSYAEFSRNQRTSSGFTSRCKACDRQLTRERKYGIDEQQYFTLKARQDGRCAICQTHEDDAPLVVDHNHESGEVRGLLCGTCNRGLGYFKDEPERLIGAVLYLARTAGHTEDMSSIADYLRYRV